MRDILLISWKNRNGGMIIIVYIGDLNYLLSKNARCPVILVTKILLLLLFVGIILTSMCICTGIPLDKFWNWIITVSRNFQLTVFTTFLIIYQFNFWKFLLQSPSQDHMGTRWTPFPQVFRSVGTEQKYHKVNSRLLRGTVTGHC